MTTTKANTASPAPADEESESAEDRVPGFKVADTIYTFPAHVPVGWGLTYLRVRFANGEDDAFVWALSQLLGHEQHIALERDTALTRDNLKDAVEACRNALLGATEDPKGS
jgi:hypothetical protein